MVIFQLVMIVFGSGIVYPFVGFLCISPRWSTNGAKAGLLVSSRGEPTFAHRAIGGSSHFSWVVTPLKFIGWNLKRSPWKFGDSELGNHHDFRLNFGGVIGLTKPWWSISSPEFFQVGGLFWAHFCPDDTVAVSEIRRKRTSWGW